jgi:hypothetical protein
MYALMLQPGYPTEVPYFTRGLARAGATVLGVGDQPERDLSPVTREHLAGYLQVPSLLDEARLIAEVRRWTAPVRIEQIETVWEPGVLLAARLREALGVPGMSVDRALGFRDKDVMKQRLQAAGVRTPRHARADSARATRAAAERIGFPAIVKPIDGAGSMDTFRVDTMAELEAALARMGRYPVVNVEEFIDGEEYTFDTICVGGEIQFFNLFVYRPRPLIARSNEWISPQTVGIRDVDDPKLAGGRAMGRAVLQALGFDTGFTHMEWFLKSDGEAVFGEIAARPPGARSVDAMNYACDIDLFGGWGEAVIQRRFSQPIERRYNTAIIFKRAQGSGRIQRIEGLDRLRARFGEYLVAVDLLPIGAPRRDWIQTLTSDGWIVVRHPDWQTLLDMADAVGAELQLYAG